MPRIAHKLPKDFAGDLKGSHASCAFSKNVKKIMKISYERLARGLCKGTVSGIVFQSTLAG